MCMLSLFLLRVLQIYCSNIRPTAPPSVLFHTYSTLLIFAADLVVYMTKEKEEMFI